jgi:hypothetical protein
MRDYLCNLYDLNNSFMTSFSLVLSSKFLDTSGRR